MPMALSLSPASRIMLRPEPPSWPCSGWTRATGEWKCCSMSWNFARSVNVDQKYAYREIRIGALYPAEALITRERVYDFLGDPRRRDLAGFRLGQLLRSPIGALLARDEDVERFLNIGELGILHYVEPFYGASYRGETKQLLDFWPMAVPILKMLRLTGSLIEY